MPRRWRTPALVAVLFVAWPLLTQTAASLAHDIPTDVTVQAFIKPAAQRLQLLVRVPLESMRDVAFPLVGPGYLDIAHADSALQHAAELWIANAVRLYEGDERLTGRLVAVRASLPADRSFEDFASAVAHVTGPRLPAATQIPWQQAMLDVLLDYPIHSDRSRFSIRPQLARLGVHVLTVLRFLPPGGAVRAFEYRGDPGLVRLDPRWHQAAWRFVKLGFTHILSGTDHLLFLLCLMIPFRRLRSLALIVTAFTVAHSVTLIASALGAAPSALWFPPLVETVIAASIVYMALENIVGAQLKRRWMIAAGFGLVHGFGFSFALRQNLQFAGAHFLTSLLSFNLGVEIGQLFVLALMIPLLNALFRFVVKERMGTIILSALVGHTAWHWMGDRAALLRQYQFNWATLDAALLARTLPWAALGLIILGVSWPLLTKLRRAEAARGAPRRPEVAG